MRWASEQALRARGGLRVALPREPIRVVVHPLEQLPHSLGAGRAASRLPAERLLQKASDVQAEPGLVLLALGAPGLSEPRTTLVPASSDSVWYLRDFRTLSTTLVPP